MNRLLQLCSIIAVIGMLAACGGNTVSDGGDSAMSGSTMGSSAASDSASNAGATSTTANGDASVAGSAASNVAQSDEIIGSLTRSGGFTGDTQTLVVQGDGTLQLLNGDVSGQVFKTAKAPQSQVDALKAAFAGSDWQDLEAKYGQQVPDGFAYTVISGGKQVVTYDGVQNPHGLDVVLAQLSSLWQVAQTAP